MCLQRFRLRVVLGYAQLFDLHCLGKAAASGQVNTCPLLCLGRECLSYKKLLLSHAFLQQQQAKILLTSDFYNSNITAFLCRVTILCLYTQPDGQAGTEILHLYKIRLFLEKNLQVFANPVFYPVLFFSCLRDDTQVFKCPSFFHKCEESGFSCL